MTNLQKLQQCVTKNEYEECLFEFETEIMFRQKAVNLAEWLDMENDPKDVIGKGLVIMARGVKDE